MGGSGGGTGRLMEGFLGGGELFFFFFFIIKGDLYLK